MALHCIASEIEWFGQNIGCLQVIVLGRGLKFANFSEMVIFDQAPPGGARSLLRISVIGVIAFNFCCGISTDSASAFVVCICSS